MEQGTSGTSDCNTNKSRFWGPCTWNNHTQEELEGLKSFLLTCEDYAYQEEVGAEGTPHIQFAFKQKNPRSFSAIKKQFPKIHIEKSKSWIAAKKYCQKEDTQEGEKGSKQVKTRKIIDPLEGKQLRPCQEQILELLSYPPDDRKIIWVVDEVGGAGKTTLAKHLCITRPNKVLYVTGKASDVKYGITSFLDNEDNDLEIVILDLVRSIENFVSYEAIEAVKNGIFYNTKYESKMVIFNSPHVIIFANFEPELSKLSLDRWNIIYTN